MAELVETDEVGTQLLSYHISTDGGGNEDRVDFIRPAAAQKTIWQLVLDIFLPAGYPNSVTSDYTQ